LRRTALTVLALVAVTFRADNAGAQGPEAPVPDLLSQAADTSAVPIDRAPPPDSTVVPGHPWPGGDSLAAPPPRERVDERRVLRPGPQPPAIWWVTVRSGLLPGWGQLANRKPLKAALLGGVYATWAALALTAEGDRRDAADQLERTQDEAERERLTGEVNAAVDRRNFRMWMMGATMIFSMLDAYVDAHFFGYEESWTRLDALSTGEPAAAFGLVFD
jgi:hypothetical protein